jgi:hypothetical protein
MAAPAQAAAASEEPEETVFVLPTKVTLAVRVVVRTDHLSDEKVTLGDQDNVILGLLGEQGLTETARIALRSVKVVEAAAVAQANARDKVQGEIERVEHDEERLRANLGAVPAGDTLHTRLVRQRDADESRLGQLHDTLAQSDQSARRARQAPARPAGAVGRRVEAAAVSAGSCSRRGRARIADTATN